MADGDPEFLAPDARRSCWVEIDVSQQFDAATLVSLMSFFMLRTRKNFYVSLEPEAPQILYLVGTAFCGSTLLSFIMDSHPDVVSIGEISPTEEAEGENYLCSCEEKLVDCPFVAKVRSVMEEKYSVVMDPIHWDLRLKFSDNPYVNYFMLGNGPGPVLTASRFVARRLLRSYDVRLRAYARRNEAFIRAALEVSGKKVFFDATKLPQRIPMLHLIARDRLTVIHFVRDPRGYVYSARRQEGKNLRLAARRWVRTNEAIERLLTRLKPQQWIRLQYEQLCLHPMETLTRITNFVGVRRFSFSTEYRQGNHHIIGNRMRLATDPRVTLKLDENWRSVLSDAEQADVMRIAGRLARRYGYDPGERRI